MVDGSESGGAPFRPSRPVHISEAHPVNSITSKTRFGAGNRTSLKTIAKGDIDVSADIAEINAGQATELPNHDIRTSSG